MSIDGLEVVVREAPARTSTPVLYLHGVPTDGADWIPFLERTGGVAPDLPGFGGSDASFLEALVDELRLERFSLLVHDWGAVGLALAQRRPEALARLVLVNALPFLPGYRWHRIARIWRRRGAGELFMGFSTKTALRLLSRRPNVLPPELVERVWTHFDHGTQRAILRLYRSAPEEVLAAAGERLGELRCPALVVWGAGDPYIPPAFAQAYADALGGPAETEIYDGAGHWPWLEQPAVLGRVTGFLRAGTP
jgi:pimeloyl-ACP methyl ester carboxylesterase